MEIALTTNASFLTERAAALAEAGLNRITVSLDSLDETVFHSMTDSSCTVQTVLDGIAAAQAAGLDPIKVNAVVRSPVGAIVRRNTILPSSVGSRRSARL